MTHEHSTRTREDGTIIDAEWNKIQLDYARWYYAVMTAGWAYVENKSNKDSEDLGDWVESIHTLMTFGPNPRSFDPPILPEEVTQHGGSE